MGDIYRNMSKWPKYRLYLMISYQVCCNGVPLLEKNCSLVVMELHCWGENCSVVVMVLRFILSKILQCCYTHAKTHIAHLWILNLPDCTFALLLLLVGLVLLLGTTDITFKFGDSAKAAVHSAPPLRHKCNHIYVYCTILPGKYLEIIIPGQYLTNIPGQYLATHNKLLPER